MTNYFIYTFKQFCAYLFIYTAHSRPRELPWPSGYELRLSLERSRVLILVKSHWWTTGRASGPKMLTAPAKSQLTIGHRPSPVKTGSVWCKTTSVHSRPRIHFASPVNNFDWIWWLKPQAYWKFETLQKQNWSKMKIYIVPINSIVMLLLLL